MKSCHARKILGKLKVLRINICDRGRSVVLKPRRISVSILPDQIRGCQCNIEIVAKNRLCSRRICLAKAKWSPWLVDRSGSVLGFTRDSKSKFISMS